MWNRWTLAMVPLAILAATPGCAQMQKQDTTMAANASDGDASAASKKPAKIREHHSVAGVKTPHDSPPRGDANSGDLLSAIGRDLAGRLNVPASQLQVLTVEQVVWNDSSLGCPQPGQSYLQSQVPGVRVLLQNSGKTYQYHASDSSHFVYCANPAQPAAFYDKE